MNRDAKFELAEAILQTRNTLEASRDPKTQRYGIDLYSAADKAVRDPDLRLLVAGMLTTGHSSFTVWAEIIAKETQNNKRGR